MEIAEFEQNIRDLLGNNIKETHEIIRSDIKTSFYFSYYKSDHSFALWEEYSGTAFIFDGQIDNKRNINFIRFQIL